MCADEYGSYCPPKSHYRPISEGRIGNYSFNNRQGPIAEKARTMSASTWSWTALWVTSHRSAFAVVSNGSCRWSVSGVELERFNKEPICSFVVAKELSRVVEMIERYCL